MSISVAELDALPVAQAAELLQGCCGSSKWVSRMVAQRPFRKLESLQAVADEVWQSLDPEDWLEAFSHHPRIGEQPRDGQGRGAAWAAGEQRGVAGADDAVRAEIAVVNREYEDRFGYIYIVMATGKSAEEMLELARSRMLNERDVELRLAAEEQRKITRLRLEKLITNGESA